MCVLLLFFFFWFVYHTNRSLPQITNNLVLDGSSFLTNRCTYFFLIVKTKPALQDGGCKQQRRERWAAGRLLKT